MIDRFAKIATGSNATFLAPYPALTPETALTLTAWNYRQACPVATTGDRADAGGRRDDRERVRHRLRVHRGGTGERGGPVLRLSSR